MTTASFSRSPFKVELHFFLNLDFSSIEICAETRWMTSSVWANPATHSDSWNTWNCTETSEAGLCDGRPDYSTHKGTKAKPRRVGQPPSFHPRCGFREWQNRRMRRESFKCFNISSFFLLTEEKTEGKILRVCFSWSRGKIKDSRASIREQAHIMCCYALDWNEQKNLTKSSRLWERISVFRLCFIF